MSAAEVDAAMDAAVAAVRGLVRVRGGDTAAAIEIIVRPWEFGPRQKPGFAAGVRDIAGAPATTEHMHEATMECALRSLAGWARGPSGSAGRGLGRWRV